MTPDSTQKRSFLKSKQNLKYDPVKSVKESKQTLQVSVDAEN